MRNVEAVTVNARGEVLDIRACADGHLKEAVTRTDFQLGHVFHAVFVFRARSESSTQAQGRIVERRHEVVEALVFPVVLDHLLLVDQPGDAIAYREALARRRGFKVVVGAIHRLGGHQPQGLVGDGTAKKLDRIRLHAS